MKLTGKVVSTHLGSEYPDQQDRVTIDLDYTNTPIHPGLIPRNGLTVINESEWELGDEVSLNVSIQKTSARAKTATASRGA